MTSSATLLNRARRRITRLVTGYTRKCRLASIMGFTVHKEMLLAIERMAYYSAFMETLNYKVALLCDSKEASRLIQLGMCLGILSRSTLVVCRNSAPPPSSTNNMEYREDWPKLSHGLIVPRVLQNDGGVLNNLYDDLRERNPGLVIFDQVATMGGTWRESVPCEYQFRGHMFWLNPGTVIPSYYANSQLINYLMALIRQRGASTMLDLCSGQGCIGLSCLLETPKLDFVLCADINPVQVKSIDQTIKRNGLDQNRAKSCVSDTFDGILPELQFDLISANPPHGDAPANSLIDLQGNDPHWRFHHRFFEHAEKFLARGGLICLIENGRPEYSTPDLFREMLLQANSSLEFYGTRWIPGSEWYLLMLCRKGEATTIPEIE